MAALSNLRIGRFTGSEVSKLRFKRKELTDKQRELVEDYQSRPKLTEKQKKTLQELLKKDGELVIPEERNNYIFEKAEEKITGVQRWFTSKQTEHGHRNEYEAISAFQDVTGLIVWHNLDQECYMVNDDLVVTPDGIVKDFDGNALAVIDTKCPYSKFFKTKYDIISNANPEYHNIPVEYYYQLHVQMMAVGVDTAYLVYYLADEFETYEGGSVFIDLPVEDRVFWVEIQRDEAVCNEILDIVASAAKERDELVPILKQRINK